MGPAARTGPINLARSQRKLSFFTPPSELKYNHNCHIVLPPVGRGYNSKLADRVGGLGWVLVDFWVEGQQGQSILGSMRTATQEVMGNCQTFVY